MLSYKPLILIVFSVFIGTSASASTNASTVLVASNLIDQNNPSSDYSVIKTLDLFEKNNITPTEENLSAFFIQLK